MWPEKISTSTGSTRAPYATQREYDAASGFKPVPPEEYVGWYADVAANVGSILVPDGSYFLNIKEHAEDGERSLYVKDLVLAHKRQWGWRFVDEFCWRKTDNGVPGGWGNRFKNAWEPVFHFCRHQQIKFRPKRVGHESDDCFDYSPNNPKSTSGSGLLGTGPRGAAADTGKNQSAWQRSRSSLSQDSEGRYAGIARPSNVVEVKSESSQGSHSAPFPRALVEFFVLAYSDEGDHRFVTAGNGARVHAVIRALDDERFVHGHHLCVRSRVCEDRIARIGGVDRGLDGRKGPWGRENVNRRRSHRSDQISCREVSPHGAVYAL